MRDLQEEENSGKELTPEEITLGKIYFWIHQRAEYLRRDQAKRPLPEGFQWAYPQTRCNSMKVLESYKKREKALEVKAFDWGWVMHRPNGDCIAFLFKEESDEPER